MENITNPILDSSPPFEISSGGDSVSDSLTKYQKQIYDNALKYAISKNDTDPKSFANKAALDSSITHGKNNPFGDLASKTEDGTIKSGIKYKNYDSVDVPLSKKYNDYIVDQHNSQQLQNDLVRQENQNDQIKQEVNQNIQQSVDMSNIQQPIINQNQPVDIPQTIESLNNNPQLIDKQESDQNVSQKNTIDQTMINNPIQDQHAYGGSMNSYEGRGNLNSFNVGGLHEQNPLGGIPQGTGSNGKMNTVEQDETSMDINGKKFIFSNRIII